MNLLKDNWIPLIDGSKTNVNDILDIPTEKILDAVSGYNTAIVIFMLLKSYLNEVKEEDFTSFLQASNHEFSSTVKKVTIDQIVYTQPRENTKQRNLDLFVKRDTVKCLCESCSTLSLFFISSFCGTAGQGYSIPQYGGKLIAFRSGNTIREIINNNKISEKYSFKELFQTPYKIKFINTQLDKCSLCGEKTMCYTEVLRESRNRQERSKLPLIVKNKKDEPSFLKTKLSEIQVMGDINNGLMKLPSNINKLNVKDKFHLFTVIYNKAKLRETIDFEFEYSEINVNQHIWYVAQQVKTFTEKHTDELEYYISILLEIYLKNNDLNHSLMEIFKKFIPDDITVLKPTEVQFLATAINRMRARYES